MDIDNTNNTANNTNTNNSAATNNIFDQFDVFQKPSPILDTCGADFKPNGGTELKEEALFFVERPANGKRSADEFDDDDFGPETNVDALDVEDMKLSSPTTTIDLGKELSRETANNNPAELFDKMDSDIDFEIPAVPSNEFVPLRETREETPTPPADSVLDSSGLADNVAESGEDSEDEWNYYRVDPKQKENSVPPVETNNQVSGDHSPVPEADSDEMSQLNPDAKEFVPVSPTRSNSAASPLPSYNRDVLDDLVAQSPRRAVPMDINVPSPVEFQCEVKQRPSEIFDTELNTSLEQNGHQLSTQEIMENLLNGKDVSEIEFRPTNINNILNDDKENNKDITDFPTFVPRAQDPMSMSFYQDKDEQVAGLNTNPFDLDKVQMLPDNDDDSEESSEPIEKINEPKLQLDNATDIVQDNSISPTPISVSSQPDLCKQEDIDVCVSPKSLIESVESPIESSKSPITLEPVKSSIEISKSLFEPLESSLESSKSPFELSESPLVPSKSPIIEPTELSPLLVPSQSPFVPSESPVDTVKSPIELVKSPFDLEPIQSSPIEQSKSPIECELPITSSKSPIELTKSPIELPVELPKSPIDLCTLPVQVDVSKSPMLEIHSPMELSSPAGPLSPKSPIPELTGLVSPDITASIKDENISVDIDETPKSPLLNQTPLEDDVVKSPIQELDEKILSSEVSALENPLQGIQDEGPISPSSSPVEIVESLKANMVAKLENTYNVLDEMSKDIATNVQELISDAIADITTADTLKEESAISPVNQEIEQVEEIRQNIEPAKSPIGDTNEKLENVCELKNEVSNIVNDVLLNVDNEINNIIDNSKVEEAESKLQETMSGIQEDINKFIAPKSLDITSSSINAFLDRSELPDVTSPLSPNDVFEKSIIDIQCETIQPEFPVHIIASPSEESKIIDTPPQTPAILQTEPTPEQGPAQEPITEFSIKEIVIEGVTPAAVFAAATAVTAVKTSTTPKTKQSTTTATKKPITKSPTSPTKPLASRPTASSTMRKTTTTTTTASKTSSSSLKPSTTRSAASPVTSPAAKTAAAKPRTPITATAKSLVDKKPLLNGDLKARKPTTTLAAAAPKPSTAATRTTSTARSTLATKTTAGTVKSPSSAMAKSTLGATRPATTTTAKATTRPLTATGTTTRTTTTRTTSSALSAKPSSTLTKSSVQAAKSTTASTARARPTSATTTTTQRPRSALTTTKTTTTKEAPDTEKHNKDAANKQTKTTSATRTNLTSRTAAATTTAATKKFDLKTSSTSGRQATTTRTITTTLKSAATGNKKPTEVTRTTVTKTKTAISPATKKSTATVAPQQNGVVSVIQEITTVNVVNDEPQLQLLKDNSPVETAPIQLMDNSQLPPTEIVAD